MADGFAVSAVFWTYIRPDVLVMVCIDGRIYWQSPWGLGRNDMPVRWWHLAHMSFTTSFLICLLRSLSISSGGFNLSFSVTFIGEGFACCRWCWLDVSNAADRNEEANGLIHYFPDCLLGLFGSCCLASFSKLFVAGFSICYPVRFHEVDLGSPMPTNRGQFEIDGDEERQMTEGK